MKNDFWWGKFTTTRGIESCYHNFSVCRRNKTVIIAVHQSIILFWVSVDPPMSSRTSIYTDGFYQRTSMTLTNFLELKSKSVMQNSLLYYRHYKTTIVTNPRIFPRIGGHNIASKEPLRHFLRIHKTVLAPSSSSDYLLEKYSKGK